jgi:RNA polymerase sigma-70 factor (ECF subfamily)
MELEDVFRAHQRAVFAYFLRLVGDRHEAEELTQETFVRACGAAIRFRGDSSVKTWLFGIARRVLLEFVRAKRLEVNADPNLPERAGPPQHFDERLDLERAFQALSIADREVLMLVDVLGFEPAEAARAMRVEPGTLRVRLHRARARMREVYGK